MNLNEILIQIPKELPEYRERCNGNKEGHAVAGDWFHGFFTGSLKKAFSSCVNDETFKIEAKCQRSRPAAIPWVGIYHNQVTKSAQEGFYIAYLFAEDGSEVHVTLMLGATQSQNVVRDVFGKSSTYPTNESLAILEEAAQEFRSKFENLTSEDNGYLDQITLQHYKKNFRVNSYEKAAVFSKKYSLNNLDVNDTTIQKDLEQLLKLYKDIQQDAKHSFFLPGDPDELDRYTIWDKLAEKHSSLSFNPTRKKTGQNYDLPGSTDVTPIPRTPKQNTRGSSGSNHRSGGHATKEIGRIGENYVYDCEIAALKELGKSDLADRVVKQYEIETDFPGYDIKSFDKTDFEEIYIEVKSSAGNSKGSFAITRREWEAAEKHKERYWVYTVIGCDVSGKKTRKVQAQIQDPAKRFSETKEPIAYECRYTIPGST